MTWTTALPDWERRIVAGESLIPCAPLFPAEAEEALAVFRALKVVDVLGSPEVGAVARPWVLDLVAAIFGSYDPDSGRRLIREFFLLVSKKNSKSTTAGLVMLVFLILNWRKSGEYGILAPTVEVANNAFKPARDAIKADPELSALLHVQDHIRTITHRETGATLQVVAAENESVAGKKWIVTLVDEVWIFGKRPSVDSMFEEATGGQASRPEGCVIWLSTQSDEPPAGVFAKKLKYARDVRDGKVTDREFMPIIYEFPKAMIENGDYLNPSNFHVTNPNIGASVDRAFIERKMRVAGEGDQESRQVVLSKYLNVEIGANLRSDRWAGAEFWAGAARALTLDDLMARSDVVTIGLDGGGLDDLFGFAALGREQETGKWLAWCHAWCHPIALDRRKANASVYRDFETDGDLTIVGAVGEDVTQVVALICRIREAGLLDKIGVDPAGIGDVLDALEEAGVAHEEIVGISQGWKLTGAIKTAERRLAEGQLVPAKSRLMPWSVANAKVEPRGNAVVITKQASGSGKIDPLMALLNAVSLMSLNPQSKKFDMFMIG